MSQWILALGIFVAASLALSLGLVLGRPPARRGCALPGQAPDTCCACTGDCDAGAGRAGSVS